MGYAGNSHNVNEPVESIELLRIIYLFQSGTTKNIIKLNHREMGNDIRGHWKNSFAFSSLTTIDLCLQNWAHNLCILFGGSYPKYTCWINRDQRLSWAVLHWSFSLTVSMNSLNSVTKKLSLLQKDSNPSHLLCERPACYHSATHMRDRIFKLSSIHASVIYLIPWIRWIQWKFLSFRKNSIVCVILLKFLLKFRIRCTIIGTCASLAHPWWL